VKWDCLGPLVLLDRRDFLEIKGTRAKRVQMVVLVLLVLQEFREPRGPRVKLVHLICSHFPGQEVEFVCEIIPSN